MRATSLMGMCDFSGGLRCESEMLNGSCGHTFRFSLNDLDLSLSHILLCLIHTSLRSI